MADLECACIFFFFFFFLFFDNNYLYSYALSLAKQGYTVHLIDAIEKHIREAQENEQNFQPQYPLASCVVGDARDLSSSFPENTLADAVLMFGPLYHLAKEDRAKALKEAHRLLKPVCLKGRILNLILTN